MKEKFINLINTLSEEEFMKFLSFSKCPSDIDLEDDEDICISGEQNLCIKCWENALKSL